MKLRKIKLGNGKISPLVRRLLTEARELMLGMGESTNFTIQFRQHGWLHDVNKLIPPNKE
jgi:hypothetical protein